MKGATFVWGDEFAPKGKMMANTWQGEFPWQNLMTDGFERTSPIKTFPPNGYGLFDMAGNVWEWTERLLLERSHGSAIMPAVLRGTPDRRRRRPASSRTEPDAHIPRKVIKGGSHLCAPNYCLRYRPAARQSETVDTSTSHIGFRCIVR